MTVTSGGGTLRCLSDLRYVEWVLLLSALELNTVHWCLSPLSRWGQLPIFPLLLVSAGHRVDH
jgi:hypothetical protein